MSAPEIWSYRAGGGFIDKHPIASERWESGARQISTYGVPGAQRSRAVIVRNSLESLYEQLGHYVHAARELAAVTHEALHAFEWNDSYDDTYLKARLRAALIPFLDPDTEPAVPPEETETEGSDT